MRAMLRQTLLVFKLAANWLRDLVVLLNLLLIPFSLSAIACIVLAWPLQTREYYRVLIENLTDSISETPVAAAFAIVISLVCLIIMAACLSFCTTVLAAERDWRQLCSSNSLVSAVKYAPAAFGAAPLFAVSYGLHRSWYAPNKHLANEAISNLKTIGDKTYADYLVRLMNWSNSADIVYETAILSIVFLSTMFLVYALFYCRKKIIELSQPGIDVWPSARRALIGASSLTILGTLAIAFAPVSIGQSVGALGLFSLFIGLLSLITTGLNILGRRVDFPIITAMLCVAAFLAFFDLNDNHELRRINSTDSRSPAVSSDTSSKAAVTPLSDAFEAWYKARIDKESPDFAKDGYPVYVVAAQGGGIYAAAQSLLFLVRLQTACERFNQHLFAISGVSGGSVGAALYAALAGHFAQTKEQCRSAEQIITDPKPLKTALQSDQQAAFELIRNDYDYLSPLVAAALFPDFAQRFFWPPIPAFSRARALEKAIENAWDATAIKFHMYDDRNALRKGLLASWHADGVKPALVMNTTEVGSGRRRVIAPFRITNLGGESDLQQLPLSKGDDVPISAAAVASASFPWITPATWFFGKSRHHEGEPALSRTGNEALSRHWVVDGGYFDNSGVATAMDIIDDLDRVVQKHGWHVQINLIVLTSGTYSSDQTNAFGEIVSPLLALFNSRQARTYSTIELARRKLAGIATEAMVEQQAANEKRSDISRLQRVDFGDFIVPLPLGWRLSKLAASEIFYQTGSIRRCVPNSHFEQSKKDPGFGSADCVRLLVLDQLRGVDPEGALRRVSR